ncbi:uncharacterized protein LOC132045444 [Lycium ferocissimum]|uniref:uncharacterized protein LOC132045444 n=1 Tax=Lycium ferocissimum TaxID=112874 RepID=UPI002814B2A1|nr:uncharacterized protein LOC132045444 [Lycium ferocissimum]
MVEHLPRTGSDHRPLVFKCNSDQHNNIKYFKFLNCWAGQDDFMEVVKESWNITVKGNAMWRLQCKLKNLSRQLSCWSRNSIGDIHENVSTWEAKMELLENCDILQNTDHSREKLNKGYAEYIRWLNLQDNLLKQKTRLTWFKDGDKNTKYFHSVLRNKRRRLQIQRIKNHKGRWIQGEEKIAKAAIRHFKKQ